MGGKKNSARCLLKSKVADPKWQIQSGIFSSATLFLENSALNFSFPNFVVKSIEIEILNNGGTVTATLNEIFPNFQIKMLL